MNTFENKINATQKLTDNEKTDRERIYLSLSFKRVEEATIAIINKNKYKIKINEKLHISGAVLWKYLISKGLEELDEKFGQIREIKKIENIIDVEI